MVVRKSLIYTLILPAIVAAIAGLHHNRTWIEARFSDGGPAVPGAADMANRFPQAQPETPYPRPLFTPPDAPDNHAPGESGGTTGQFPGLVGGQAAGRTASPLASSGVSRLLRLPDRRISDEDAPDSVICDMKRISAWGSSSVAGIADRFSEMASGFGAAYYNGGKGGERSEHIAARLGARPALLSFPDNEIPASGSVTVMSSNMPASPYLQPYAGTVAGVAGTLSSTAAEITFTRSAEGEAVSVSRDAPFMPDVGPRYRDAVAILWMGKNNFSSTAAGVEAAVIQQTDQAFGYFTAQSRHVLVLGHFNNSNVALTSQGGKQLLATNAAYATRYGNLYVDVQGYLTSPQVWIDTGITPTQEDLELQATGRKPISLSSDAGHLNSAGYAAVAEHLVKPKLIALGWYK